MRSISRSTFLLWIAASVSAQNLVLSNDDGWAVGHIRAFNTALRSAGFSVVLSAPAENKSGSGSSDATPTTVSSGCEFSSCPTGSPATGFNASDTRLNYVNSFPVTSMKFGIQTLSPKFFGGAPDLAVAGPNVGTNLGSVVLVSGTVGAATEAAKEGIPSIAFSGSSGSQVSYTSLSSSSSSTTASNIYASLSTTVTQTLLDSGAPFLPPGITLNVNYPATTGSCSSASAFHFVFTRINSASSSTAKDVTTCGTNRLPTENSIVGGSGCLASISVMNATTKGDVDASTQSVVLDKLSSILTCK